ncbi:DedA family protein [Corynebacterium mendelii]|uniref:VTT domain-containing protein n=1 Tax=Corynebacterium mendelii TaxID=2765362 RepID=A0A939E3Y5_9CORY|nr:VTT domain-containing protein [Corynebacterium mendelii]MBN9645177.1 VTT domain-containing protein [Corynebacterium mendelii]
MVVAGPQWLDPMYLLSGSGPFGDFILGGILLIVFIESGVLFPVLPGDSLLFTGGMLASQPDPFAPLWLLALLVPVAGTLGGQVGYFIGHKFGEVLSAREDSRFFKKAWLEQSHAFFVKHGPITVIICRFVPIVRTFASIVAGMSGMKLARFTIFNIVGAIVWGAGLVLLGAWLGQFAFIRDHIEAIFLFIVFLSITPGIWGAVQKTRSGKNTKPA